MTKKIISLVLSVLLIIGATAVTVNAVTYSGTCGDNLTWTLYESGKLTITGTGDMYDWDRSGEVPWYSYRSKIKSVEIGDSVTSIGNSAFADCSSLTSVVIPDSVTTIGNVAFANCDNLTSVDIGDSVTTIGYHAFYSCSSLTSITVDEANTKYSNDEFGVLFDKNKETLIQYPLGNSRTNYTIPDSVTTIGYAAFSLCTSLTSVDIPDSITTIGDNAFARCYSLTSVDIGEGITSIGYTAFAYCGSLTSVVIPDSVTSIGYAAFGSCDSLTSAVIPDSVTSIGDLAFASCDNLTIYGYTGSYAETYAKNNDIPFIELGESGDVNADGKVDRKDLNRLAQYFARWDVEIDVIAADANGDGNVDRKDLNRLAQYFARWDVEIGK